MSDDDDKATGLDPVVSRMLSFYKLSSEAESDNRKRGLAALKFGSGGQEQWDTNILRMRQSDNRPSESYNQIPQFVHQITNDQRMNMPSVKFLPGNEASRELAEVREDLARCIQSSSEAEVARDTAVDYQVRIGWGYYRILTDYENATSFDQIIKVGRIRNPFTVYDDPYSLEQDRSDRKKLIQVCDYNADDFNQQYERKYDSHELSGIGDSQPGWATEDTVRVAEYWELTEKMSKLYRLPDGTVTSDKPKGEAESRDVAVPKVMWYKCTAKEVLESKEWPGIYIPYVRITGEELDIDGDIKTSGIIEGMMSSQKQINYWTNAATEMVALAPKAPFIMAVGQVEGLEKIWDNANTKNYPYLPYKPASINGTVIGPPQRQQAEAPIQAMMAMVQQAQNSMYTTTGIYPASLGKQGNESSGKAIMARQKEGDVSTFHYSDNTARAVRFEGRIYNDLIPKIYDTKRTVTLLKEDRSAKVVTINDPNFVNEKGERQHLDMANGIYDVAVTTGPSYTTKRQEAADSMTQLVQAAPQLMQVAPDIIVSQYDFPYADKLAERLKKTLPPGLTDDQPDEIPPHIKMQLEQAQQIIQQGAQEIQGLQAELANKQADNAAKMVDVQNKQMDMQLKAQQMQLDAQESARKAQLDEMQLQLDAQELQLKREELELEHIKVQLEAAQMAMPVTQNTAGDTNKQPQVDMSNPNMVQAHLQTLQERQDHEEQEKAMDAAKWEALLHGLSGVQEMLAAQTQATQTQTAAITAPKSVVRDPKTGLVQSLVTGV